MSLIPKRRINGLDEYQTVARETKRYPTEPEDEGLTYCAMGLGSEAGEFLGRCKKVKRDGLKVRQIPMERRMGLIHELGDSLWYIAMAAEELGITLSDVATFNYHKLQGRLKAGTIVSRKEGDE